MKTSTRKCCTRLGLLGMLLLPAGGVLAADDYRLIVSGTWPVPSAATVETVRKTAYTIGSRDMLTWVFDMFSSAPVSGIIMVVR